MNSDIKNKLKAIATLEAIIEPEWEYRYFSFDSKWAENESMASMRDGQGSTWFLWFKEELIGYKCISKEDGLINNFEEIKKTIPSSYLDFIQEPAFHPDSASAVWLFENNSWRKIGLEINHLIDLNQVLEWSPKHYKAWADEYYEQELNLQAIESIFNLNINEETIKVLNSEIDLEALTEDLKEIGIH